MFEKLFKKNSNVNDAKLYAPVDGKLVSLEEVPDPVFSEKMMGDGIAVKPTSDEVLSPCDGKIVQVFHTKHAVGIQTANGADVLIHVGLETVELNGEGFTSFVDEGDQVKQGDKLIKFDKGYVAENAKSTIIPIVITNTDDMNEIVKEDNKQIKANVDQILVVKQ